MTMLQINPARAKTLEDLRCGHVQLKELAFEYQNDKQMVSAAVHRDPSAFQSASPELQYNADFVKELVRARVQTLQYAPKALKLDREIALEAVASDGKGLAYVAKALT